MTRLRNGDARPNALLSGAARAARVQEWRWAEDLDGEAISPEKVAHPKKACCVSHLHTSARPGHTSWHMTSVA
jgi:hypothetical protein